MSFTFQTAKRKGVHVILGLAGGTGSGKTWSMLELATGLAGGKPFAVIDTEAGRSLQYADYFDFQHGDLKAPFSPDAYLEAILAAEAAKFPVVAVDSFSHEHAGDGGILDQHTQEVDRMVESAKKRGNRNPNRDTYNMLGWARVKPAHKRMVARLLQLRVHLILCFRAEPKAKPVKVGRKTEIVDMGWQPIAAKGLDFEMAASFMLRNENPGQVTTGEIDQMAPTGHPMKLPEPLKKIFAGTYQLSKKHGSAVAEWAKGPKESDGPSEVVSGGEQPEPSEGGPSDPHIGESGAKTLADYLKERTALPGGDRLPKTIRTCIQKAGVADKNTEDLTRAEAKEVSTWIYRASEPKEKA